MEPRPWSVRKIRIRSDADRIIGINFPDLSCDLLKTCFRFDVKAHDNIKTHDLVGGVHMEPVHLQRPVVGHDDLLYPVPDRRFSYYKHRR